MNQIRAVMPNNESASAVVRIIFAGVPLLALAFSVRADAPTEPVSFADMSLEELGSIRITSVSKKPERLGDAAGSVFVITAEDIRRSGATSLPEALRLAPNLHVARSSGSGYAISARGSNGSTTSAPNKLLVLIDGRSVYTPLFSGVFWDVQEVMLEDVERIEVSSGPGGTLWGINAVNGVINVITRSTESTRGGLLAAHAGDRLAGATFRYGGTAGTGGHYRVYGKYSEHDRLSVANGSAADDAWHKTQAGFRADWERPNEQFMVQGNAYGARIGQPEPGSISIADTDLELGTIEASGINLTVRWEHRLDNGSRFSLQAYYDRTERTIPPTLDETLDIVDLQFQHSPLPTGTHALTWGADYRHGRDRVKNTSSVFAFLPGYVDQDWGSLFAQDEMTLREDLRLTLGARLERNPYSGAEILPNARLAWKLAPQHLLWTALSRTVRGPSRLDADAHIPRAAPFVLEGGPEVRSEIARVVELGYRGQPVPDLSWSVTAFHTDYDDLRSVEIAPSGTSLVFANEMEGETSGVEMWGSYQALPGWRLSAGYTAMNDRLRLKPGSNDIGGPTAVGKNPAHTWQLRSALTIAANRELDIAVRHVAALSSPDVPAYTAVDARFGWRLRSNLELSLAGMNLLDADHGEYGPIETRSRIPRTVFLQLLWLGSTR
jgi:iron complex outermembrane receptor protein